MVPVTPRAVGAGHHHPPLGYPCFLPLGWQQPLRWRRRAVFAQHQHQIPLITLWTATSSFYHPDPTQSDPSPPPPSVPALAEPQDGAIDPPVVSLRHAGGSAGCCWWHCPRPPCSHCCSTAEFGTWRSVGKGETQTRGGFWGGRTLPWILSLEELWVSPYPGVSTVEPVGVPGVLDSATRKVLMALRRGLEAPREPGPAPPQPCWVRLIPLLLQPSQMD